MSKAQTSNPEKLWQDVKINCCPETIISIKYNKLLKNVQKYQDQVKKTFAFQSDSVRVPLPLVWIHMLRISAL